MNNGTDSKINVLKFSIDSFNGWVFRPEFAGPSLSQDLLGQNEMN